MFDYFFFNPLQFNEVSKHPVRASKAWDIFYLWAHLHQRQTFLFHEAQYEQHQHICVREFNGLRGSAYFPIVDDESEDSEYRMFRESHGLNRHWRAMRVNESRYYDWRIAHGLLPIDEDYGDEVQAAIRQYPALLVQSLNNSWFLRATRPQSEKSKLYRRMPYGDYLKTPHWRRVRASMLLLNNTFCQHCDTQLWDKMHKLHVHHLTYERIGCERFSDLMLLCETCHALMHNRLAP